MAALLRSGRLLKFSPSGLLQITGSKRNGPPLSRLYGGAVGGQRAAVCSRQLTACRSSEQVSRQPWPYVEGSVRGFALATEQKEEHSRRFRSKQSDQFDWALSKMDQSVKRTGCIPKSLLMHVFKETCRSGNVNGNQALLLLRSCGSLLAECPMAQRTEILHDIWQKLEEQGISYDASHYNALLKVYLQNEFKFSPTDFLAKMEAANTLPNRVTYQRLIAAYCQAGDMEGAGTILGFMKSKDLAITEVVFNSLVTGHARSGDIEGAKNILTVMRSSGIEPGPDTYVSLLNAYAEMGDMEGIKQTMELAEKDDCTLVRRDLIEVILSLAKAGHQEHVPEIVKMLRSDRGYLPEAMNLCLSLITQGMDETAFMILKSIPKQMGDTPGMDAPNHGNFFLRYCVNADMPVEKMADFCKRLQEANLHTTPLEFTLYYALRDNNKDMCLALMSVLKEQGLPLRPHYFYPLLAHHVKDKNTAGVVELVRAILQLGVSPDSEMVTAYIIPAFPSSAEAHKTFKDEGLKLNPEYFLSADVQWAASNDLGNFHTMVSDPSFPTMEITIFRERLISSFRKFTDIQSMVNITDLIYRDARFSRSSLHPNATGSFLLYSLMDTLTEVEIQAHEADLREFFNKLREKDIIISNNIFKGIRNILNLCNVPELLEDIAKLVDPNEKPSPIGYSFNQDDRLEVLERKLAELQAENKPVGNIVKQLIAVHSARLDLEKALDIKRQYPEDLSAGNYAVLINLCCRLDNADEALSLKRELSRLDSSVVLDASKYIALMKVLAKNGRLEEALDILKEMKEKDLVVSGSATVQLFHALNHLGTQGDVVAVRQLHDTIFTLGLTKPTTNLCSPLITAYLHNNDISAALEAAMECQKRYGLMPRLHDILVHLVDAGNTELLQKAMDFVNQERGEMALLYDLYFAFMQTKRFREARKVIETPGLRARPGRLQWYAEKCIAVNEMESLEQMVEMTAKLFECDRDEMYSYVLRCCKKTNDWKKAEAIWTKMQEENVVPRERTLRLLADILKSNGQTVPFQVPETWYELEDSSQQDKASKQDTGSDLRHSLLELCKSGKAKEAMDMLCQAGEQPGLPAMVYDFVIRALLTDRLMEDAVSVHRMAESHCNGFQLSERAANQALIVYSMGGNAKEAYDTLKFLVHGKHTPSRLGIARLVQELGNKGDVETIQEVEKLLHGPSATPRGSTMIFTNNTVLAHIKNGNLTSAVELLENIYTVPETSYPSMSYVFKKIYEQNNGEAIDKLAAMAERLANQFAHYRPATDLFFQLLDIGKLEEARLMLERCGGLAEQRASLLSYTSKMAQRPGQADKVKAVLSLVPDYTEKDVHYSYVMKCYSLDRDLPSAKALYEQWTAEGMPVNELSLKRLAVMYRNAGEEVPFVEPPESFKFYANKLKSTNP